MVKKVPYYFIGSVDMFISRKRPFATSLEYALDMPANFSQL